MIVFVCFGYLLVIDFACYATFDGYLGAFIFLAIDGFSSSCLWGTMYFDEDECY
jgi:hypothetical protein